MKFHRILLTAAVALATVWTASAQSIGTSRVGVMGGFTSSNADADMFSATSYNLYHAGIAAQLNLGAGFCLQPAVTYQVKGTQLDGLKDVDGNEVLQGLASLKTKVGYVEVPVQVQWGPDLLAFRPYVFAEPFVGFAVNTSNTIKSDIPEDVTGSLPLGSALVNTDDFKEAAINRLEYGLGFGAGIEFWRIQVSARYFWNFGSLFKESGEVTLVGKAIKAAFEDGKSFNGFSVSAAIFF